MERTSDYPGLDLERAILVANWEMGRAEVLRRAGEAGPEMEQAVRMGMDAQAKLDSDMYHAWTETIDRFIKGGNHAS